MFPIKLRLQVLIYLVLQASFLLQFAVIYPIEQVLFGDKVAAIASAMFLPHGVKAICVLFNGVYAFAPVFLAHLVTFIALGLPLDEAVFSGFVGLASVAIPLMLYNYLIEKPLTASPLKLTSTGLNLFRFVMVFAFTVSLLNALSRASYYAETELNTLALRFLFGDIFGTLVVLVVLIASKSLLLRVGQRIANI